VTTRYRMRLRYDGHPFAGWQFQPGQDTIQGKLEHSLARITGEPCRVHGSGRTDTGVHAQGQVAHFNLGKTFPIPELHAGLNALLPAAIRVDRLQACAPDFHARYSAIGKEYRYFIYNGPILSPFEQHYRTQIERALDLPAMQEAAAALVGRHDFAAFAANSKSVSVRDLRTLQVRRRGREWTLIAEADGFLYKMVRSLAGYLIRVGQGDLSPETAGQYLDAARRTERVPTAKPQGLFLWRVHYPA